MCPTLGLGWIVCNLGLCQLSRDLGVVVGGTGIWFHPPPPKFFLGKMALKYHGLSQCLSIAKQGDNTIGRVTRYIGRNKSISAYRLSVKFHRYANPGRVHLSACIHLTITNISVYVLLNLKVGGRGQSSRE